MGKEGSGVKLAVWLLTIKSQESTWIRHQQVECDTTLESLEEGYKFGLDLVPIGGWGKKLWSPKVLRVQTGTISRLHFGSPGKKCHSDVASVGERREYYMGEGGGFPRVQAMASQVSPRLLVACPNTKRMQNEF
jgi:hypothetical protein